MRKFFDRLITLNDKTISILGIEGSIISFIAFFSFIGAMGKSAQIFYIHGYQMLWRDQHQYLL